jgi:hypothetical protein
MRPTDTDGPAGERTRSLIPFRLTTGFRVDSSAFIHGINQRQGKGVPVLLTEHHAMKAYWGSERIAPLIL